MFDWYDFVLLGNMLCDIETEEAMRTAISRFYYGFFGIVRRYLINVRHKFYLSDSDVNVHGYVLNELKRSNDSTEQEMSKILNKLRIFRNHADYDEEYDKEFFDDFFEKEIQLNSAIDIVGYFKNHPNY